MHKTAADILAMRKGIAVVTSYDYTMTRICDGAGVDILLVGDSAGMVMLGYESTVPVTMDQMCLFTEAVGAARKSAMIVTDLPFMSYQASVEEAVANSGRLIKAGADAVKLEGGAEMAGTVSAIVRAGIPVMGHIGLQPQTAALLEGYRLRGRTTESAARLVGDARSLAGAGAFCIVLEMVSHDLAEAITGMAGVPTIGIGSGPGCSGQVLVLQDLLGMYERKFSFVKRYRNLAAEIGGAVGEYVEDVREGRFPESSSDLPEDEERREYLREIGRESSVP